MDRSVLCDKLMIWVQTFELRDQTLTVDDFCDGNLMSKVLNLIAPEFFSSYWLSKIKTVDASNWRLKVINLKKVLNGIIDYHIEVLGLHISEANMPDLNLIGESSNREELSRMLQLILSCAVNCKDKSDHIRRIMDLEESVQQMVMTAIQELMLKDTSTSSDPNGDLNEQIRKLTEQLNTILQEKDELCQRCHELDMQVTTLAEENSDLHAQNNKLNESLDKSDNLDDPTTIAGRRVQQQFSQILALQEEVFRHEAAKEDFRLKYEVKCKEHADALQRVEELTQVAEQNSHLKDELDVLRHTSEQVERYESTIETYKRRFDQFNELKEQLKQSEEKVAALMQEQSSFQEESKKSGSFKEQLYNTKKLVLELESKLDEQTKVAEKAASSEAVHTQMIDTLTKEKERFRIERDSLKELNEELQCVQLSQQNLGMGGDHTLDLSLSPATMEMLSVPLPVRQKMLQLEHEVKKLQPNADKQTELEIERDNLKSSAENSATQQKLLQKDIETLNKRLIALEIEKSEAESTSVQYVESNSKLTDKLRLMERDMVLMEDRYKRYLDKAKTLIRSLDPRNTQNSSSPDVAMLHAQIEEKDKHIQHLEKEIRVISNNKEQERKLMVSAWYNMSNQLHRRSIEERLTNSTSGQSFLARQRQAHIRRKLPPTPTQHSTPISNK